MFGSLLHKISVDFFLNSEGGRRLRGLSFLLGEAVSLQLGVVLVVITGLLIPIVNCIITSNRLKERLSTPVPMLVDIVG